MSRPPRLSAYDDDFFAWTQEQAAALREMPASAVGPGIDIAHVAGEIEDLGKRDLREVSSFLELLFEHLIKIESCPTSPDVLHWRTEARHFRRSAEVAFSPGMRQLIDLSKTWRRGCRAARDYMNDVGATFSAPVDCPFALDELLADDFDLDRALAMLAAAPRPDVP